MSLFRRRLMEMKSEVPSKPNLATVTSCKIEFDNETRTSYDTPLRANLERNKIYEISFDVKGNVSAYGSGQLVIIANKSKLLNMAERPVFFFRESYKGEVSIPLSLIPKTQAKARVNCSSEDIIIKLEITNLKGYIEINNLLITEVT